MMKSAANVERKDGSRMKCEHLTPKAAPTHVTFFLPIVNPKLLRVSLFVILIVLKHSPV